MQRVALRVLRWALFLATLYTVTRAGVLHVVRFAFSQGYRPFDWWGWDMWGRSFLVFTLPLLGIILAHEYGHVWSARRAGLQITGPYFLPWPMLWAQWLGLGLLVGTVGAFVTLSGRPFDRIGAFWTGASGPVAGLFVSLVCVVLGLSWSHPGLRAPAFQPDPLILRGFLGGVPTVLHPVALAGRYGLILTGLNLLPIWPLDGWRIWTAAYGRQVAIDDAPLPSRLGRMLVMAGMAGLCLPCF